MTHNTLVTNWINWLSNCAEVTLVECVWPILKPDAMVKSVRGGITNDGKTSIGRLCRGTAKIGLIPRVLAPGLMLLIFSGVFASSSTRVPSRFDPQHTRLSESERCLRRLPAHNSEFTPISEPLALGKCGNVRPPEALLTPDPLLPAEDGDLFVRVSFIVGSDGHVHSAFVLTGSRFDEDEAVLRAVRQWRYRPALCNGVPTDSEARIRFSIR